MGYFILEDGRFAKDGWTEDGQRILPTPVPPWTGSNGSVLTLANNAEGGTNGTTVTVGNSGGSSGIAWDTVSISSGATATFDATHAAHGSFGYHFTVPNTTVTSFFQWAASIPTPLTDSYYRTYAYLAALPGATLSIIKGKTAASGNAWRVDINTAGKVVVLAGTSLNIRYTSTLTVPTNAKFRVELHVASSSTAGSFQLKLFTTNPDGTNADEDSGVISGIDTGANTGIFQAGITAGFAASADVWLDDIGLSTTGYLGSAGIYLTEDGVFAFPYIPTYVTPALVDDSVGVLLG